MATKISRPTHFVLGRYFAIHGPAVGTPLELAPPQQRRSRWRAFDFVISFSFLFLWPQNVEIVIGRRRRRRRPTAPAECQCAVALMLNTWTPRASFVDDPIETSAAAMKAGKKFMEESASFY